MGLKINQPQETQNLFNHKQKLNKLIIHNYSQFQPPNCDPTTAPSHCPIATSTTALNPCQVQGRSPRIENFKVGCASENKAPPQCIVDFEQWLIAGCGLCSPITLASHVELASSGSSLHNLYPPHHL